MARWDAIYDKTARQADAKLAVHDLVTDIAVKIDDCKGNPEQLALLSKDLKEIANDLAAAVVLGTGVPDVSTPLSAYPWRGTDYRGPLGAHPKEEVARPKV